MQLTPFKCHAIIRVLRLKQNQFLGNNDPKIHCIQQTQQLGVTFFFNSKVILVKTCSDIKENAWSYRKISKKIITCDYT